jgi:hypothetical protein
MVVMRWFRHWFVLVVDASCAIPTANCTDEAPSVCGVFVI